MMTAFQQKQGQERLGSMRLAAPWRVLVLLLMLLGGCSDLISVEAPDVTEPESLDTPDGALARRAGALGIFATGFSWQVLMTGLMTDELSELVFAFNADRRTTSANDNLRYPFPALNIARINALRAIQSLQLYNPTPPSRIGELYAFTGYVELFFAENLCSGVPLGSVIDGLPVIGSTLTREELISLALAHFDSAAAFVGDDPTIGNLTRVGRGRTLLYSGDAAAADAAVAGVPMDFAYRVEYSTEGQNNDFFEQFDGRSITVSDREGINGLPFVSANDPRLPTQALEPKPRG